MRLQTQVKTSRIYAAAIWTNGRGSAKVFESLSPGRHMNAAGGEGQDGEVGDMGRKRLLAETGKWQMASDGRVMVRFMFEVGHLFALHGCRGVRNDIFLIIRYFGYSLKYT